MLGLRCEMLVLPGLSVSGEPKMLKVVLVFPGASQAGC